MKFYADHLSKRSDKTIANEVLTRHQREFPNTESAEDQAKVCGLVLSRKTFPKLTLGISLWGGRVLHDSVISNAVAATDHFAVLAARKSLTSSQCMNASNHLLLVRSGLPKPKP